MTHQFKLSKLEKKEFEFRHKLREAKPFQVDYIIRRYENWVRRYHLNNFNYTYNSGGKRI